jgi:predicted RNase H-like HicB family nuclease
MKNLGYYRGLPYTRSVELLEEGGERYYLASVRELPGVRADGESHQEALTSLRDAFDDYIRAMQEWGRDIPEPVPWPRSLGYDPGPGKVEHGHATIVGALWVTGSTRELPRRGEAPKWVRTEDVSTGSLATVFG